MDTTTFGQASATDDQELVRALENMNDDLTIAPTGPIVAPDEPADTMTEDDATEVTEEIATPVQGVNDAVLPNPVDPFASATPVLNNTPSGDLESIKKEALAELRPLVGKLVLPPEEKFSTLLLIVRSTNDRGLVAEAYQSAKTIEDESKRAEALLEIIKEIDGLSQV